MRPARRPGTTPAVARNWPCFNNTSHLLPPLCSRVSARGCVARWASAPCGWEATMRLHIESFSSGRSTAVLFAGQLLPRRGPRGMFVRYLEGLRTPMGLPLFVQALYDACSDHGLLVIRSGDTILARV